MTFTLTAASPHQSGPGQPPALIVNFAGPVHLHESATLAMETGRAEAAAKLDDAMATFDNGPEKLTVDRLTAQLRTLDADLQRADADGLSAARDERDAMLSGAGVDAAARDFAAAVGRKAELARRRDAVKQLLTQSQRAYNDARADAKRSAAQKLADDYQAAHDAAGAAVGDALAGAFESIFSNGAAARWAEGWAK